MKTTAIQFVLAAALAGTASAQGDPMEEIRQIAAKVGEQLQEVDRLLLESSAAKQARQKPIELIEQSRERGAEAKQGIDDLIEKLTELKNSSGGSGQPQDDQQNQQDQNQQDQQQQQQQGGQSGRQNRRENQTPDFVQQEGQQQGEQQGQQQGQEQQGQQPGEQQQGGQQQGQPQPGGQPQGGQESLSPGENKPGNTPPQSETGPGQPGTGTETWGELQPYLNSLKNRGSSPKVPQKYRKYWEAYLKNKQSEAEKGGGK